MFDRKPTYPNSEAADRPLSNPISQATIDAVRRYRLDRLRAQLDRRDIGAILLYDPINIRYATDATNMQLWTMHNANRYALVTCDGPVILFEFHGCHHLAEGYDTIDEVRSAVPWYYFAAGPRMAEKARDWAAEITGLVGQHCAGNRRLAVDRCEPSGFDLLKSAGLDLLEGQELAEQARAIKSPEELELMAWTITVCESGMRRIYNASRDGATENEVWAELHHENIRNGGEWIETRLLASGPRTNPWMRESSARIMRSGEILAFDTDLIGPYGYCADLSRTWTVDHTPPTAAQRELYLTALEQIRHNAALLRPGLGFRDFIERAWPIPEKYRRNRYASAIHGVGLCDEYPAVPCLEDFAGGGYDGVFEENMTVCVESYIGTDGGSEGVKLEIQVAITANGCRRLDSFPFEDWA